MKRATVYTLLMAAVLFLTLSVAAKAQTIVPSITVTGINTPACTPGQLCRATGYNFLQGYPFGFGWANGAVVNVYSVMPDGSLVQSPRSIPNLGRVDFYPKLGTEGAVAYRFVSPYINVQTGPLITPTPTFAPVIFARGRICYSRPAPGACQDFNGTLTFPANVGIVSLVLEAAGTGAFSSDWTVVISDGPNDEQSTFGLEFAATSFPAGQGNATDTINTTIGFLRPGLYYVRIYKPVPDGTIVQSASTTLPVQQGGS